MIPESFASRLRALGLISSLVSVLGGSPAWAEDGLMDNGPPEVLSIVPSEIMEWGGKAPDEYLAPEMVAQIQSDYPGWELVGTLQGSFTRPGVTEILAAIVSGAPLLDAPGSSAETRLLIVSDGDVVETVPNVRGALLGPVMPGDGERPDLVMLGEWFMRQGIESVRLRILSLEGSGVTTIHDIPDAYISTCREDGSGQIEGLSLAFEDIYAAPEKESFTGPCSAP